MQPVQIGMNSAIVLLVLLLAVPLQLFLSHYINTTYKASPNADSANTGGKPPESIQSVRTDALHRLNSGATYVASFMQSTIQYYSKWKNFKDLFLIPYKREASSQHGSRKKASQEHTTKLESQGKIQQDHTAKHGSQGKVQQDHTAKYGSQGKVQQDHTAKHGSQGKVQQDHTAKHGSQGKVQQGHTTKHGSVQQDHTTKHGSQGKVQQDHTEKQQDHTANLNRLQGVESDVKTGTESFKPINKEPATKDEEIADEKETYFANSKIPRVNRSPQVKLKVGQVVKPKSGAYYGVIVGWDEVAKASEEWLKKYYSKRPDVIHSPHYLVLVDSQFSSGNPLHYLPQEDLELMEAGIQIQSPKLNDYFDGFKNHRHLPRPWLHEIYPNDL